MPNNHPCLWFDNQAQEAAAFYVSIFPNSSIEGAEDYVDDTHGKPGSTMTVSFTLDGQRYMGLNGGPMFTFSEAISLVVNCKDQAEVDYYWDALVAGGKPSQCGWLKDRYGLSWQIVPVEFQALMASPDKAAVQRMIQAMYGMAKLDLPALKAAFAG